MTTHLRRLLTALALALGLLTGTAGVAAADTTVAVVGDAACSPTSTYYNGGAGRDNRCQARAVAKLAAGPDVNKVLIAGDSQYEVGALSAFRTSYTDSYGPLLGKTWAVPGNHEYKTTGAAGFFDYFGAAAGENRRGYYSRDLGPWHIVMLNSERVNSTQLDWLKADLAANRSKCTLAVMHRARFSSGYHLDSNTVRPLWDALSADRADVVVAGHDHDYERFAFMRPDGTVTTDRGMRSFVVGTGGKDLRPFEKVRKGSQKQLRKHGLLKLRLRDDGRFSWAFVAVDGATYDSGTSLCR